MSALVGWMPEQSMPRRGVRFHAIPMTHQEAGGFVGRNSLVGLVACASIQSLRAGAWPHPGPPSAVPVSAGARGEREAKSLGPDGTICTRGTVGLLQRRLVRDLTIRHIGKETNEIEEVGAGLVAAGDATTTYTHPSRDVYSRVILPALLDFPEAEVAHAAGIPRRTINGLRGGRRPDHATLSRLVPVLADLCVYTTPRSTAVTLSGSSRRVARSGFGVASVPRVREAATQASGSIVEPLVARPPTAAV